MAFDPTGKRVLITGASSGIGAALARGFAERGAVVGICARREQRLHDVLDDCRTHSPESQMWVVDLADLDGVTTFTQTAIDALGGLDVLVNNAGVPKRRLVRDMRPDEVDTLTAINYLSPVRVTLAALPTLLARGHETGEPTHVVNISSVAARLSPPGEAAYAATKAALTSFSESMAAELWAEPVQVHLINPGVVATDLFDPGLADNDRFIADDVERLAPSAVFDAVLAAIDAGAVETWVPEWFADVAKVKADDLGGFLEGASLYWREKQASPEN
jgi:NAD(P)-dependent dehydrogenase (short-subunit alcohol dehydrogenase family)